MFNEGTSCRYKDKKKPVIIDTIKINGKYINASVFRQQTVKVLSLSALAGMIASILLSLL
ncbi:MAG: hypothetical protein IJR29_10150 [Butyrivibrio sp.]|nr:hypothetical protein [Butyrivibrio sp.]